MRYAGFIVILFLIGSIGWVPPVAGQAKEKDKDAKPKEGDGWPTEIQGKRLEGWIADIRNKDMSIAQLAIRTVVHFGPAAEKAVPNLTYALSYTDASVRGDACAALAMIRIDDQEVEKVVKGLTPLLASFQEQMSVRLQATVALAHLGTKAKAAIGAVGDNTSVLGGGGKSWELRRAAVYALGKIAQDEKKGPDPGAMKHLIASLNDPASPVRLEAIMSLSVMGRSPRQAEVDAEKKALEAMLGDKEKVVAIWARVLLIYLDNSLANERTFSALGNYLLKDGEVRVRASAAQALGALAPLGTKARPVVPLLIKAIDEDKDRPVIVTAIEALGKMGEAGGVETVDRLGKLLNDFELPVRASAMRALGTLKSRKHLPAMMEALKDKEPQMVLAALAAMVELGDLPAAALAEVENLALTSKDEDMRYAANTAAKMIRDKMKKKN